MIDIVELAKQVILGELTENDFPDDAFDRLANQLCEMHPLAAVAFYKNNKRIYLQHVLTSKKYNNYFITVNSPSISDDIDSFMFSGNKSLFIIDKRFVAKSPNGTLLQLILYHERI